VHDGAVNHALEAGRGLRFGCALVDEIAELGIEIFDDAGAKLIEIHIAGAHHGRGIAVIDQGGEQMLEGRKFMAALVGVLERAVQ
jgi:hypothetical protein